VRQCLLKNMDEAQGRGLAGPGKKIGSWTPSEKLAPVSQVDGAYDPH
jgi:hypothetical protein